MKTIRTCYCARGVIFAFRDNSTQYTKKKDGGPTRAAHSCIHVKYLLNGTSRNLIIVRIQLL
jgi:hypothetical protein